MRTNSQEENKPLRSQIIINTKINLLSPSKWHFSATGFSSKGKKENLSKAFHLALHSLHLFHFIKPLMRKFLMEYGISESRNKSCTWKWMLWIWVIGPETEILKQISEGILDTTPKETKDICVFFFKGDHLHINNSSITHTLLARLREHSGRWIKEDKSQRLERTWATTSSGENWTDAWTWVCSDSTQAPSLTLAAVTTDG